MIVKGPILRRKICIFIQAFQSKCQTIRTVHRTLASKYTVQFQIWNIKKPVSAVIKNSHTETCLLTGDRKVNYFCLLLEEHFRFQVFTRDCSLPLPPPLSGCTWDNSAVMGGGNNPHAKRPTREQLQSPPQVY